VGHYRINSETRDDMMLISNPATESKTGKKSQPSCHFFEGKCSMDARRAVKNVKESMKKSG